MSNVLGIRPLLLSVVATSLVLERITSYLFLPLVEKLVEALNRKWPVLAEWPLKMLATSILNMAMYGLVARDFMTPLFDTIDLPILPWQGLIMSFLVIGGGSNLVHDIFQLFGKKVPSTITAYDKIVNSYGDSRGILSPYDPPRQWTESSPCTCKDDAALPKIDEEALHYVENMIKKQSKPRPRTKVKPEPNE